MQIKKIEIKRLRCVLDDAIECEDMAALVGKNGAGKSCFLYALRLLYQVAPSAVTLDDFYNRDASEPIQIRVTFGDLLSRELEMFGTYVQAGQLIVTKRIQWNNGKPNATTFGASSQHEPFVRIRAITNKNERKSAYHALCNQPGYETLDRVSAADNAEPHMKQWEETNRDKCQIIESEEQLLGAAAIGVGSLDKFTKFVFVPAVRDVTLETADTKTSTLGAMLTLVVTERVQDRADLKDLRATVQSKYSEIFSTSSHPELDVLATDLTRLVSDYHPGSSVALNWRSGPPPELAIPAVEPSLLEDGFKGDVTRKGHGLQRAMILALLQARAETPPRKSPEGGDEKPIEQSLILAIEEPELYQHPQQCRHWISVLRRITRVDQPRRTQVLFTTHSPHFVDVAWFNQIRLVRKVPGANGTPSVTNTKSATLADVAVELAAATGRPAQQFTDDTTRARTRSVMTTLVNEGFFAGVAVLVEGNTEIGILRELARLKNANWDAKGIAVIEVNGKTKLDKPLVIFRRLGIPTYVLFDGDADHTGSEVEKNKKQNVQLLRLLAATPEDFPPTDAHERFAVIRDTTEKELREALTSAVYDELTKKVALELGYDSSASAMKNIEGAALFTTHVYEIGKSLPFFERVVQKISAMAPAI